MADANSTDLLMVLKDRDGNLIDAESTVVWDKTDKTMMAWFEAGKVFELEDFGFGVALEDTENLGMEDDDETETGSGTRAPTGGETSGAVSLPVVKPPRKSKARNAKFRGYVENDVEQKGSKYPVTLEEITVSRQLDKASTVLLKKCLNQEPLGSCALVRRKFTGNQKYHEAFLRLEFQEPLIVSVEWEDGDIVKEKLKFVCRGVKAAYRPQKADGTLGDAIESSFNYDMETL